MEDQQLGYHLGRGWRGRGVMEGKHAVRVGVARGVHVRQRKSLERRNKTATAARAKRLTKRGATWRSGKDSRLCPYDRAERGVGEAPSQHPRKPSGRRPSAAASYQRNRRIERPQHTPVVVPNVPRDPRLGLQLGLPVAVAKACEDMHSFTLATPQPPQGGMVNGGRPPTVPLFPYP